MCVHNGRSAELAEFRKITTFQGKPQDLMNTLYILYPLKKYMYFDLSHVIVDDVSAEATWTITKNFSSYRMDFRLTSAPIVSGKWNYAHWKFSQIDWPTDRPGNREASLVITYYCIHQYEFLNVIYKETLRWNTVEWWKKRVPTSPTNRPTDTPGHNGHNSNIKNPHGGQKHSRFL